MWLILGATCSVAAAAAFATTGSQPAAAEMPAMPVSSERAELPVRTAEQSAPIAIVGVAASTKISRGEPMPITFYAVNRTAAPLRVLRSLDASDVGWRYPKLDIEIRDANGTLVEGAAVGRCGMMNPLTADDFVEIASGERAIVIGEGTFGHYKLWQTDHLASGRYTVTLHYDLSFAEPERRLTMDDATRAMVDALPKGVYSSAPITIDVN